MSAYSRSRYSKLRDETSDLEDGRVGTWTREKLVEMDTRYCEAVRKALAGVQQDQAGTGRPKRVAG